MKVREAITMIEKAGWRKVRQKGSHRQYKHPTIPGTVTIAGGLSLDILTGTLNSIRKQAMLKRR